MTEFIIHPLAPVMDLVIVEYPRVAVNTRDEWHYIKHNSLYFRDYVSCIASSREDLDGAVRLVRNSVKGDVFSRHYLKSFAEELVKIGEEHNLRNVRFIGKKYCPPRINEKRKYFHEPNPIYFNSNEVNGLQ